MHHWDPVHETGIAPYPVVPTYRPDPPFKRRNPSMPIPVSASPNSTRSAPRYQARSAGMAERPTRNENLSDLVRFFQTQSMPTDTTTALPTVESPNREQQQQQQRQQQQQQQQQQLKPFHRRLLQFTQRQKKDPSKPKIDDNQKQIEALQREGYLFAPPPPKQKGPKGSLDSSKSSLDRSLSKSKKKDVETIGQPWLEDKGEGTNQPNARRRLASLDLDDFGSMVDVAVSLSEFDDSVPPPYQATSSTGHTSQSARSVAAPTLQSSSSGGRSSSFDRPMSPASSSVDVHHVSRVDFASRRSSSSNSSLRIVDPDTNPSPKPKNLPLGVRMSESSNRSTKGDSKPDQPLGPPQTQDRPPPNLPTTATQPSLKLFPDVAPPRMSSKNAWRLSAVPRYQTAPSASSTLTPSAQPDGPGRVKSQGEKQAPSEAASAKGLKDDTDPAFSGALVSTTASTETATAQTATSLSAPTAKKVRPPSLAMGTLKAFPLPAPTRPLPSVPKTGSASTAAVDGKPNANAPPVRSGLLVPSTQFSQPSPIAEDPREPLNRPATALGYIGSAETKVDDDKPKSRDTTPERPKSTSPEQHTPKRRADKVRMGRMQELPESPPECRDEITEGQPMAESPVLGQMSPTKPYGRRAASKGLQINPQPDRTNLPFGLPSPPPTASLPSDPPPYPPPERPLPHRNFTTPNGSGVPPTKGLEMTFGPGIHRGSIISRSNSSRSSLRHDSIPESYEPSRPESPLPSSDEEGFAPGVGTSRSRRDTEKRIYLANPTRRGYESLGARAGSSRPRYPHPMRPMTPQSRSCHNLERTTSPQSQYSQSTYPSRESAGHHRAPQPASQASHLLEDRVANLERQNQILQAALMAALNAGAKNNMVDISDAMSPALSAAGLGNPYQGRFMSRPESWVSSSRSSDNSGFETPASMRDIRANARQLDHMIEDIEAGWLSDKSSLSGARSMTRHR